MKYENSKFLNKFKLTKNIYFLIKEDHLQPGIFYPTFLATSQMQGMHFLAPPKAAAIQAIPNEPAQAAIAAVTEAFKFNKNLNTGTDGTFNDLF